MAQLKTSQNTIDALKELEASAVKARIIMDGNDLDTWKKVLAFETRVRQLRESVEQREAAE